MLYNYGNFAIHIPQMLAYIPYMDPMGIAMNTALSVSLEPEKLIKIKGFIMVTLFKGCLIETRLYILVHIFVYFIYFLFYFCKS